MSWVRRISQNSKNGKWAYIEYPSDMEGYYTIIGGLEFDTQEEAVKHSKQFEWTDYGESYLRFKMPAKSYKVVCDWGSEKMSAEELLTAIREDKTYMVSLVNDFKRY